MGRGHWCYDVRDRNNKRVSNLAMLLMLHAYERLPVPELPLPTEPGTGGLHHV